MLNVSLKNTALNDFLCKYKILNLGGEDLYINGIKKILKFDSESITISLKSNEVIEVKGKELYIREMSKEGIMISGKIQSTEVM